MRRAFVLMVVSLLLNLPAVLLAAAVPDAGDSSASAAPAAAPAVPANESSEGRFPVGVGVKTSTLGLGGEVAVAVSHRSNVRFGFNAFSYGHTFDKDGATYTGNLNLRSAQATYDLFPANCQSISSDPTIQSNVAAEQAKLNKSASPYKFYPVLSFGVGYKF